MGDSFEFEEVEGFSAGAVGAPGQRVFYIQFRSGSSIVSLRLEKQQVSALGEYLQQMLADLPQPEFEASPPEGVFTHPVVPAWIVGGIGAAYDTENDRIVLVCEELVAGDEDDDEDGADLAPDDDHGSLRVRITRAQAAGFALAASELVNAGRPACPFCGRPMDPDGHPCPRMN